jgi:exodeoxyribonuclease VII small subunit
VTHTPADTSTNDPEAIGYTDALTELEEILDRLEGTDVDVDELGSSVKRAASLIEVCRRRLDAARLEVERVVAGLEDAGEDAGEDTGDGDGDGDAD